MSNNQLLASDNFASGSLAAGWSAYSNLLKSQVVGSGASAVAEPNTLSVVSGQIWTGLTWPKDQISEITLGPSFADSMNLISVLTVRITGGASPSGYEVNIGGSALLLYRYDAGAATQLGSTVSALTIAAGDVWTLAAVGGALVVYQNYKMIIRWQDSAYTSGSPGFLQYATASLAAVQVKAWRGYSAVQQDGIWQKQGVVLPAIAGDFSGGAGGQANATMLYEGNPQILSGTVYKMWFSEGPNTAEKNVFYAESTDGITWTRKSTTVLANYGSPFVIKNGTTYWMYVQPFGSEGIGDFDAFSSADGITWALQQADTFTLGTAGQWDDTVMWYFQPVYISGGTWYAIYSAGHDVTAYKLSIGLATSTDGKAWTRYASNPVMTLSGAASVVNGGAILKVGSLWYMWIFQSNPGRQTIAVPDLNPGEGTLWSSPDLITWTFVHHSVHQTHQSEGVNYVFGQSYPNSIFNVAGKTYMYIQAGVSDNQAPATYQIALAIAPVPISSIIQFNEDGVQQVATDAFTSGAGDLSANWTLPTGGTKLKIVSGPYVEPTATSTVCQAVYTGASFTANQYSEIVLQTLTGTLAQSLVWPTVRNSLVALTDYEGRIASPTGTSDAAAAIYKRVAGVAVQIGPTTTIDPQAGDILRLSVIDGSDGFPVLSLFQNGFLVLQVQDQGTTPLTTGNPGIQAYSVLAIADAQIASWAGGNANVIPAYPSLGSGALLIGARGGLVMNGPNIVLGASDFN